MGYCIDQLGSQFHISSEAAPYAHAAIRNLFGKGLETIRHPSGPHYRWVTTKTVLAAPTLKEAMEEWRYELTTDPATGDHTAITFTGEKSGDEDVLFPAIAPYVTAGSYIVFMGEDGARWRWVFDGTTARTESVDAAPKP
jgi:hypothetical protein